MVNKMKKYKIVMTEQVKKDLKTLPPKVLKSFNETCEKLKENPYMGEMANPIEVKCIGIEQRYGLESKEVLSLVVSNYKWFETCSVEELFF